MGFFKEFLKVAAKDIFSFGLLADDPPDLRGMPGCPTCGGKGEYGGLRAYPNDPGGGVAPMRCGCIIDRIRLEREQAEQLPHVPSITEQTAATNAYFDDPATIAAHERKLERLRLSGEITLCCGGAICICKQNLRLIDGVPTNVVGTMRPGWEDDDILRGIAEAGRRADAAEAAGQRPATYSLMSVSKDRYEAPGASETTMPLPVVNGGE